MQLEAYVDPEENCVVSEGNQIHAASFLDYCIYSVSTYLTQTYVT